MSDERPMNVAASLVIVASLAVSGSPGLRQDVEDPAIRAAVERFYAVQEAEDVDGYLALWSSTAPRLKQVQNLRMQLKFIFDNGDDKFSNIAVERVVQAEDRLRVRVSAARARTSVRPDGTSTTSVSALLTSLTFVREGGSLKLFNEGSPTDDLAEALIAAPTAGAREALLAADPDLVNARLLASLSQRADALAQSNQPSAAHGIYLRVLELARRLGDPRAEGQALQNIANARYFMRDFGGALDAYQQRLIVDRKAGNEEGTAGALFGIATIQYSTYEYAAALASYEEAGRIQEKLSDDAGLAVTLLSTGNVRYLQGDLEAAITDYRRSRDLQRKLGDARGEANALAGLARSLAAQGDLAAALSSYAGVQQEARTRNDRSAEGHAIQSIGEIHMRLGNLDTARGLFDESRARFEAVNDQASVGRVWQAAALTDLLAARFGPAEQEYLKSSTACALAKEADCVARATVGLAYAQASQSHFDDAIMTYGKAIAAFTSLKKPGDAARAELGLSQAQFGKQEYMAALVSAGRAGLTAAALRDQDLVWRALVAEGRAARRLKTPDRAMAAAKDAVAAVQRLAAASLDDPGEAAPADSVEAFAFLALLQAEAGDAAGAFDTLEARRASGLRSVLGRNEREIAKGLSAEEREAERRAATTLASLRLKLEYEQSLPKPDAARLARFEQAIAEATAVRRQDQERLFEQHPDLRSWRGLTPPLTLADVNPWLWSSGALVVQFVMDDDDLVIVTAGKSEEGVDVRAYAVPASRQSLAEKIAKMVEPAILREVVAWRKASTELLTVIPADVTLRMFDAARAVVVPDGVLWRVPFEALPVKDGQWADQTTVSYAGSLASLVASAPRADTAAEIPLTAIGAPAIAADLRARLSETAPGWVIRGPENASAELKRTVSAMGEPAPVVLTGEGATESAFRMAAPRATMLQVAAPFRISSASPLFSPVLLAGEAGAASTDVASDGVLQTREVMNLALRAELTVFSDGAAVSMRDAAGAIPTIQFGWRVAGVPAIVMPRWVADETAGPEWLATLLAGIRSGAAPASAVRAASAAIRNTDGMSAPFFWAGWMLVQ
jgi:tetratricopeptide (TPR) repeat protein